MIGIGAKVYTTPKYSEFGKLNYNTITIKGTR